MTEQGRQGDTTPPGRPLWQAAERERVAAGLGKQEWTRQLGIGRVTYDRLFEQENPPIARTVKKIADQIGLDYDEAMRLAGLSPGDLGIDAVLTRGDGTRVYMQVKHYGPEVERTFAALRETASKIGRTLGDVLVMTGLADPQELRLSEVEKAPVAGEIAVLDLPDNHRREQVAETSRRRRGPA